MQEAATYPPNDPVAQKAEWTPLKRGGATFCTHKLTEVSSLKIEFRPALGAKLFYSLFLAIGIATLCFLYKLTSNENHLSVLKIAAVFGAGFVFTIAGVGMFYSGTKPIVFDKNNGYFWKGRKEPGTVFNMDQIKVWTKLERIYAIQLITEYCRGAKHSHYYSYELNLILKDSERINVVDHGSLKQLQNDADKLSAFLGKPVWYSCNNGIPLC